VKKDKPTTPINKGAVIKYNHILDNLFYFLPIDPANVRKNVYLFKNPCQDQLSHNLPTLILGTLFFSYPLVSGNAIIVHDSS